MIGHWTELLWQIVNALILGGGGLLWWGIKRWLARVNRIEGRISDLETWQTVVKARAQAWREFGSPERRTVTPNLETRCDDATSDQ